MYKKVGEVIIQVYSFPCFFSFQYQLKYSTGTGNDKIVVVLIGCEELPKYHNSNKTLADNGFRGLFLALFQAATRRRAVHSHQHLITYATNEMDREREEGDR